MALAYIVVLGIVQGLTEFLPVSSKTHLAFAQYFLRGGKADLSLTIMLHAGSLLAILLYYRRAWVDLVRQRRKEIVLLVVGTIPAALAGFLLKKSLERLYGEGMILGSGLLLVNALFLFVSERKGVEQHELPNVPLWKILAIGVAQAAALLPGISRSGSTIGAAYLCGLRRPDAVRFSFFLGAIAITGALGLDLAKEGEGRPEPLPIVIGVLVTFVVSLAAIKVVEVLSLKGRFSLFALYCAVAGVAGLIYFTTRG